LFVHDHSKGISRSSLPYRRTPPSWCRAESDTVKQEIVKFAKKGLTPSQIGVRLRDSMGVPQVATVTGSKILRILKVAGMFQCSSPRILSCV
jgi:small subunit ribosomal protein S13e